MEQFSRLWCSVRLVGIALITLITITSCGSGGSSGGGKGNPPQSPSPTSNSSCPVVTVAESVGPTSGVAPFPLPAPLPPPDPGTTSQGSVCVSTPADNATVTSPVHIVAAESLVNPIDHMRVYVDGTAEYFTFYNTVDALLWMDPGSHALEVIGTDKNGNDVSTSFQLNVVAPASNDNQQHSEPAKLGAVFRCIFAGPSTSRSDLRGWTGHGCFKHD